LQAELQRALTSLWGGPLPKDAPTLYAAVDEEEQQSGRAGRYDCLVLELNYFKQIVRPIPKSQADIYNDILHISRATHDRHLHDAVARLGTVLLQRLRAAFRPEQPPFATTLIGRDELIRRIQMELQAGASVALSGPSGVGKSSLAAAVTDEWPTPATFWFTIRPTFNDHLGSLLFALGHFLHLQGASTLWHHLIAAGGQVTDFNLARGLASADLAALPNLALLVIDELDFLRPADPGNPNPNHVQLIEFVDSLRGHVPLLLIGQRTLLETDAVYALNVLDAAQISEWLNQLGIHASEDERIRLHEFTGGNPRLLHFCLALFQLEENATLSSVLDAMPRAPTLPALWFRIQRRLTATEQSLMQALAVFRSPAPVDAFRDLFASEEDNSTDTLTNDGDESAALSRLRQRQLLFEDERGGLTLLPAVRSVIYDEMSVEVREANHQQAAQIRSERGEYTAAAYHYWSAGLPNQAIEIWFPNRTEEIQRGQAPAALSIFQQISQNRLDAPRQKQLALLRSELYQLAGAPEQTIAELAQVEWSTEDEATPEASLRWGEALDATGDPDAALRKYQQGIDTATQLLSRSAQLYVHRSTTQLRQRNMTQAWREAKLARFQAENMMGAVQDQQGNFDAARAHYEVALELAEDMQHGAGLAQIHHYLAILASRQGDFATALPHFTQAVDYYERVHDLVNRENVRSNLASAYIQIKHFQDAIEPAHRALQFFRQMENPVRIAQNASNLAEAHAELGNLNEAQHFAELVLQQEEPHSHPYALYTLGTVRRRQQRFAEAEQYYSQCRRLSEINDDTYLLAYAWRALGTLYAEQGQADLARQALRESLRLSTLLGIDDGMDEINAHLQQLETI
jgi:tetratricopeptide (TPR) repeat protein